MIPTANVNHHLFNSQAIGHEASQPDSKFPISESWDQEIGEFYVVQKVRAQLQNCERVGREAFLSPS